MSGALAKRYAAALAGVAMEKKNGEAVERDLTGLVDLFFASADFRNFLESPAVGAEVKRKAIGQIAAKMGISPAVRNFVSIIVDNRRTEMLREIQESFHEELNARLGIAEVEVRSARGMSEAQKKELTGMLERRTGKKIEARFSEDEALLGGAIVRVGSTIYDGSVRGKLNRLREQIEAE